MLVASPPCATFRNLHREIVYDDVKGDELDLVHVRAGQQLDMDWRMRQNVSCHSATLTRFGATGQAARHEKDKGQEGGTK